jgi:hypothetical protein
MTDRITIKDLNGVCSTLNRITKSDPTPYAIGNFYITSTSNKYALERGENGGGYRTICGYTSAKDLYNFIHAFIDGYLETH